MAVHTVQSGDSLWKIAQANDTTIQKIIDANPQISDPNKIYPGQQITIPDHYDTGSTPAAPSTPAPGASGVPTGPETYTVQSGDSMTKIAQRHGVSLAELLAANPQISDPNKIYPGQKINIPGTTAAPTAPPETPTTSSYKVVSGDTMSKIANKHGVSLAALIAANPQIADPNKINIGQMINIPGVDEPPIQPPVVPPSGSVTFNLTDAQIDKIIDNTSKYEGNYDSLNRNSDGAGLSFGFIQFAQGPGSLGTLLTAMRQADPEAFSNIFGANSDALVSVTTSGVGNNKRPVGGAVLWEEPWCSRFIEAGNHAPFQAVQRRLARDNYFEPMLPTAAEHGIDTERGLAILYDMAVQHGVGGMRQIVANVIAQGHSFAGDEHDALMACAEASADHVNPRWHDHVLNRRLAILRDGDLRDISLAENAPPVNPGGGVETPGAFTPPSVTLKNGSRGPAVTLLQNVLLGHGFAPGPVDGIFGPKTEAAVKSFQAANGLATDGIVGPQTWAALAGGEVPETPEVPVTGPTEGAHMQAFPVAGGQFNIGWDQNWNDFNPATGLQNTDFYLGGNPGHPTGHLGIDVFGPKGAPMVAPVTGEIVRISHDDTGKGGRRITIKRGNHYFYLCHMDSVTAGLKVGDTIQAGAAIGTLGNSGNASGTAPHLHFSIYTDNNYSNSIDPFPFLMELIAAGNT